MTITKQEFIRIAQERASTGAKCCVPKVTNYEGNEDYYAKYNLDMIVQEKHDGVNCSLTVINGELIALSRTGKEFFISDLLRDYLLRSFWQSKQGGYVLLGELCCTSASVEVLSGLVNPNRVLPWEKCWQQVVDFTMYVFDKVTIDEYITGESTRPYHERVEHLSEELSGWLQYTTSIEVHRDTNLQHEADDVIARGGEGIIIRNPNAGWEANKKSRDTLRIKRKISLDLTCLDVKFGKGKREGQIAALQFENNGVKFWADLGKGWTDVMRNELTQKYNHEKYHNLYDKIVDGKEVGVAYPIGKVFHVTAMEVSSKGALRQPKVEELRIDKEVQDGDD